MNKIYTISDTHFGHSKMEEWALRPHDFNEKLWNGFNQLPEDAILIHCGDVTLGADATTHIRLQQYKFKKWLILGNHDHHSISWYVKNGWDFVGSEVVLKIFGENVLFTHEPQPRREYITKNIHGHLHGGKSHGFPDFYDATYHIEVCPEVIGYFPAKVGSC
jgi:calcineurin-like phosphoesterase family protein